MEIYNITKLSEKLKNGKDSYDKLWRFLRGDTKAMKPKQLANLKDVLIEQHRTNIATINRAIKSQSPNP